MWFDQQGDILFYEDNRKPREITFRLVAVGWDGGYARRRLIGLNLGPVLLLQLYLSLVADMMDGTVHCGVCSGRRLEGVMHGLQSLHGEVCVCKRG